MLLSGGGVQASDEQILGFLAIASQRGVDVHEMWVASDTAGLIWTLLPVESPGRTVLILSPARLPFPTPVQPISALLKTVCDSYRARGAHLAQMLLDPAEESLCQLYAHLGFIQLAELLYLQRQVKRISSVPPLERGLSTLAYSSQTHPLFLKTVAKTYEESLDCPALNGLRDMEDVLEGHKGGPSFDPSLWLLLMEYDEPRGVLLMGRTPQPHSLELVYLGLTKEARGRGTGDMLMNLAMVTVVRSSRSELTLAVDSRNEPALRLYHRHGLRRVGSRAALIRDLRV